MKKTENAASAPQVGWFIYVNSDPKKAKPVPKWVTVNGCWLEISQKSSENPYLIINLGFIDIKPLSIDENCGSNGIFVATNSFQGSAAYRLWTNNRFDIIELCDAIQSGQKRWDEIAAADVSVLESNMQFSFSKKSRLLTKNIELSFDKDGLNVISKGSEKQYKWCNIVNSKCNDNKQTLGIEISLEGTKKKYMQYQCHDINEVKSFLTDLYYFLSKNKPA